MRSLHLESISTCEGTWTWQRFVVTQKYLICNNLMKSGEVVFYRLILLYFINLRDFKKDVFIVNKDKFLHPLKVYLKISVRGSVKDFDCNYYSTSYLFITGKIWLYGVPTLWREPLIGSVIWSFASAPPSLPHHDRWRNWLPILQRRVQS